jgi:pimeloyl-ACP methyl ester carboxylesterase
MTNPDPDGIWWESAGDPRLPTIVLVHGSMDRSAGLLRLGRRLDDEFHVVRLDRRGYGRSRPVGPPWTISANVDDVEELTSQLGVQLGVTSVRCVIGHSLGGDVALALAERRPDLVEAVVVYETPLSWLDWWPRDSAGAAAVAAATPADAAEAFMRRLVGDAVWERLPPAKQEERRSEGAAMVAELADLRRAAPWSSIEVPVLALCGEHGRDHHRRGTAWLGETLADCRVATVPGAGHAGPHTHPSAVAAEIVEFLSGAVTSGALATGG